MTDQSSSTPEPAAQESGWDPKYGKHWAVERQALQGSCHLKKCKFLSVHSLAEGQKNVGLYFIYFYVNLTNSKPKHYNSKIPNFTTELSVWTVPAASSSAVSNLCTPETPFLKGVKSICNKRMYMHTILHFCKKFRFFAKFSHFFRQNYRIFSQNFHIYYFAKISHFYAKQNEAKFRAKKRKILHFSRANKIILAKLFFLFAGNPNR